MSENSKTLPSSLMKPDDDDGDGAGAGTTTVVTNTSATASSVPKKKLLAHDDDKDDIDEFASAEDIGQTQKQEESEKGQQQGKKLSKKKLKKNAKKLAMLEWLVLQTFEAKPGKRYFAKESYITGSGATLIMHHCVAYVSNCIIMGSNNTIVGPNNVVVYNAPQDCKSIHNEMIGENCVNHCEQFEYEHKVDLDEPTEDVTKRMEEQRHESEKAAGNGNAKSKTEIREQLDDEERAYLDSVGVQDLDDAAHIDAEELRQHAGEEYEIDGEMFVGDDDFLPGEEENIYPALAASLHDAREGRWVGSRGGGGGTSSTTTFEQRLTYEELSIPRVTRDANDNGRVSVMSKKGVTVLDMKNGPRTANVGTGRFKIIKEDGTFEAVGVRVFFLNDVEMRVKQPKKGEVFPVTKHLTLVPEESEVEISITDEWGECGSCSIRIEKIALVPCGHMVCWKCHKYYVTEANCVCPFCKQQFTSVFRVRNDAESVARARKSKRKAEREAVKRIQSVHGTGSDDEDENGVHKRKKKKVVSVPRFEESDYDLKDDGSEIDREEARARLKKNAGKEFSEDEDDDDEFEGDDEAKEEANDNDDDDESSSDDDFQITIHQSAPVEKL